MKDTFFRERDHRYQKICDDTKSHQYGDEFAVRAGALCHDAEDVKENESKDRKISEAAGNALVGNGYEKYHL